MDESLHLKYLAVSPSDLLWGTAVNSVGFQEIAPGSPYPPSNHPSRYLFSTEAGRTLSEFQLLYITQGKGKFTSASLGRYYSVEEGTMFLLFPGEWHNYCPDKKTGWKEFWIGFEGQMMEEKLKAGLFSPDKPIFHVGIQSDIVALYNSAIKVAQQQESGFQPLLGGIVNHLLGLAFFYDKNRRYSTSEVSDLINKAKIIIYDKFRTITPEEVAEEVCLGYSNFRKIFKDYTGFSPAKYIREIRFNKAKEELTNTTTPIKAIAYDVGFNNYEYFFTSFRKSTGMTPLQYREMTQGEAHVPNSSDLVEGEEDDFK